MNNTCPICKQYISDNNEARVIDYFGVPINVLAIVIDDTLYCGSCMEKGVRMMLEGKACLTRS